MSIIELEERVHHAGHSAAVREEAPAEALRHESVGLMIARGDFAVELSFEKLAEMQEEILWFGEACHLPVI